MQFRAEAVTQIYVGKDKVCRCGCKGEYVQRGEAKFDARLKRFARMWATYTPSTVQNAEDIGPNYMNISYGGDRAITVYFD